MAQKYVDMSMDNHFRWVMPRLPAADLQQTIDFYTGVLGFSLGVCWPDGQPTFCTLHRDGVGLGFHQQQPGGRPASARPCELYIEVVDVRSLHAAVRDKVHVEWGPEVYSYGRREFAFSDPNGYLLIFTEETDDPATCEV